VEFTMSNESISAKSVDLRNQFGKEVDGRPTFHAMFSASGVLLQQQDKYRYVMNEMKLCYNPHKLVQIVEELLAEGANIFILFDYQLKDGLLVEGVGEVPVFLTAKARDIDDLAVMIGDTRFSWNKDNIIIVDNLNALLE
jgi:hypothetical protein